MLEHCLKLVKGFILRYHFRSKSVLSVQRSQQERCLNRVDTWWLVKVRFVTFCSFQITVPS